MTDNAYPKPVNDYTQPELYTDHTDNRIQWAWEFIRRNPRFQMLTDKALIENDRGYEGSAMAMLDAEYYPWLGHWQWDTFELADDPEWAPGLMQSGLCPRQILLPRTNHNSQIVRDALAERLVDHIDMSEEAEQGRGATAVAFAFDISQPLAPQLKEAERVMRDWQKHMGITVQRAMDKPRAGDGIRWLQILDALAAAARPVDIMTSIGLDSTDTAGFSRLKRRAERRRDALPTELLGFTVNQQCSSSNLNLDILAM